MISVGMPGKQVPMSTAGQACACEMCTTSMMSFLPSFCLLPNLVKVNSSLSLPHATAFGLVDNALTLYVVLKFNFLLENIGGKDQTLDQLVIEALIPCCEPTLP